MDSDHRKLLGSVARSSDGARLGHVADVYVDAASGIAKWLVLRSGLFTDGVSFVPAEGVWEDEEGRMVVPYSRRQVRKAPHPPADGELLVDDEAALARHYVSAPAGVEAEVDPGVPEGGDDPTIPGPATVPAPAAAADDTTMVRAEEELDVDTPARPVARARLVKRVVTEEVTIRVPVRREVLELVHEDLPEGWTDPDGSAREPFAAMPDQEHVLYAEVVEYTKRVVARERVRLVKETAGEVVDLRTGLRKEQVEAEEPAGSSA